MIYRKFQDIQLSGLGLGMMRLAIPRPRFRRYWRISDLPLPHSIKPCS